MPEFIKTPFGLSLKTEQGVLHLDFLNDKINYLRPLRKGKNELIARAVGFGKGVKSVIDVTAGLAQDAVVLARLGFDVRAIERSELIFPLLQDARHRAIIENFKIDWLTRLEFIQGESAKILIDLKPDDQPDAIYMDPMFPEKKKGALPRKEMQIFRTLVGNDDDAVELLKISIKIAKHRVVVKRPLKAPDLLDGVVHRFKGSSVRYDLYLASH